MKKQIIAALSALALAVTLTACGDKAKEAADQSAAAAKVAAEKAAEAAKAAAADAAAKTEKAAKDGAARDHGSGWQGGRRDQGSGGQGGRGRPRHAAKKHSASFGAPFFTKRHRDAESNRHQLPHRQCRSLRLCVSCEGKSYPLRTAACCAIQRVSGFHCSQSCSPRERGRSNTE